jgi:hypothetical protein
MPNALAFWTDAHCIPCLPSRLPNDLSSGDTSYSPYYGLTIAHDIQENSQAQGKFPSIFMSTILSTDPVGTGGRDTSMNTTTISMLTDNVLLELFDLYREGDDWYFDCVWQWHLLAHVCQRWRQIIFASPHHLALQLLCKHETPVRKHLGIWPTIPIIMLYWSGIMPSDEDNVIAALEHPNRVCCVTLSATRSQWERLPR